MSDFHYLGPLLVPLLLPEEERPDPPDDLPPLSNDLGEESSLGGSLRSGISL